MGYCTRKWISDYHYKKILEFRRTRDGLETVPRPEPGFLVWGRVAQGRITLEPTIPVTAPSSLPRARGPFLLQVLGERGTRLYSGTFHPTAVPDGPAGEGHFAFVIPRRVLLGEDPVGLQVSAPGFPPALLPPPQAHGPVADPSVRVGGDPASKVTVEWDPAAFPMALIRDRASGQVLAFARAGRISLSHPPREIEVTLSNGFDTREPIRRIVW
jgi:hypothetical protein